MRDNLRALDEDGFFIAPAVIDPGRLEMAERAVEAISLEGAGSRNLLEFSWCQSLVAVLKQGLPIAEAFPQDAVAVQCTLFEKSGEKNWLVALHQDLSIPVRERVHDPRLGVWSHKEGGHFVQAPLELLEQLLAVRVHIDPCGKENGPLRVVPGSHRRGRISESDARRRREADGEVACEVDKGGALVFRPLLLHASSKAVVPARRRVLHFLFAPAAIGYGLGWQHAV
jgi:hypothetical protein